MAATPSVRIDKSFSYKTATRRWSNRYHFNGGTPADDTHWHTLMDAVVAAEALIFPATVTIVNAVGYAAGSDVPVASKTYSTAGSHTVSGGQYTPGDTVGLIRYSTNARTTKNHPIYLFNYYHGLASDATSHTTVDTLLASIRTAMGTYAAAWIAGFSDGSITAVRASPNGAAATGSLVEEYLTHRDFPYTTSV